MTFVSLIMYLGSGSRDIGWRNSLLSFGVITGASVVALPAIIFTYPKEPNVSINFALSVAENYNTSNGYNL